MPEMLTSILSTIRYLGFDQDTDIVDRLHSFITTNTLISFALLVSFKQFGGRPIECATPETFNGAMEEYTESYCWSRDTYFVPMDEEVPLSNTKRTAAAISYYQWVPFFLLIQAIFFRLPSIVWGYTSSYSGLRVRDVLSLATDHSNMQQLQRAANITAIAQHVQNALRFHRRRKTRSKRPHKWARCMNLPYSAFYVSILYLCVKLWTLVNVTLQLYFMNSFLNNKSEGWFGYRNVARILNGTTWERSGLFPRITLCDVQARVLGGVHIHTLQCVLVINLFTEKIFILLWFWFVLLMIITFISLLYWACTILVPYFAKSFIARHLALAELSFDEEADYDELERFVNTYLRADGVFILRMVSKQSGIVVCNDLINQLWMRFYRIDHYVQSVFDEQVVMPTQYASFDTNRDSQKSISNPDFSSQVPLTPRHPILRNHNIRGRLLQRLREAQEAHAQGQRADTEAIETELIARTQNHGPVSQFAAIKKHVSIQMAQSDSLDDEWQTARNSDPKAD